MERLTDGSTFYWTRVFPVLWSGLLGVVTALAWMDRLGDAPAPLAVKVGITAAWALATAGFSRWLGGFQDVWLDDETLVVGDPSRGTRIPLREVRSIRESRLTQLKTVTLELGRPTPWGHSVRFIPRGIGTFMIPFASSPVVRDLEERRRRLLPPGR